MTIYKHMHKLASARDDESRPLAERVIAAEVMETAACRNNPFPRRGVDTQGDRTQSDGGDGRECGPHSRLDSDRGGILLTEGKHGKKS